MLSMDSMARAEVAAAGSRRIGRPPHMNRRASAMARETNMAARREASADVKPSMETLTITNNR
ncbi:hypothetical protein D9M71_774730 [compost metagenome]